MNRRTFLLVASPLLGSGGHLGCSFRSTSESVGPRSPGVSDKVVDRLEKISAERRAALARNPSQRDPYELNGSIPEINAIELNNEISDAAVTEPTRLIAWNMERGRHWKQGVRLIREHPALSDPFVIFLGEMDLGMARSANQHTAREMALALNMNYAYGIEFLELTNGEPLERVRYPGENEWGYHGNAILSRARLRRLRMVRFPGIEKWYGSFQSRLGGRMALFATVEMAGTNVTLVATHLESSDEVEMRHQQMKILLEELAEYSDAGPVLLGGDLNAPISEPLFRELHRADFMVEEANDLQTPTRQTAEDGRLVLTQDHIDYLCVRDVEVVRGDTSPKVVPAVYPAEPGGLMLGDHAIVTVEVRRN